ncbi:polyprenyl synthetase family protein [Candidatus Walczuchella monophlebidarum]|uniref:Polyprenyl synthetase n=1 Tax=Candidatus Walczuchella monophlebidarum TaxID=1415657 RepID=A0A068DQI5_9FLAO|nr:polyprenyl synthetase family protein [Candidatus Walczuchella monophlebidarum]AID37512.1 polyprenyl synthetase [Candidatus Walczuchella monophlebidarum]
MIKQIQEPILEEMKLFDKNWGSYLQRKVPMLKRLINYIIHHKGKQIRPMLVFLIAKMLGTVTEKTHYTAVLIELIHTATLIHDDVVDGSPLRRGFSSINALWKNKIAVLFGDYLLSEGLIIATKIDNSYLFKIISKTIRKIIESELLQIETSIYITENKYEKIIRDKTASLISACCEGGACSMGADEETCFKMKKFGEIIGLSFQIKDDLFDYSQDIPIGKPIGIDFKERKITLPLIHVLSKSNSKDKKWIIDSIKYHNNDTQRVQEIIKFVKKNGGINYAIKKMNEFRQEALKLLEQFPENPSKIALKTMVNYIIERQY